MLVALCAFLGWLFFLLLRACRRQGGRLGKLLGYGATLALLVQFLGYILSNLGFALFDSLPLPFLISGNFALMVNLWLAGLLTAVLAGGSTLRDGLLWGPGLRGGAIGNAQSSHGALRPPASLRAGLPPSFIRLPRSPDLRLIKRKW